MKKVFVLLVDEGDRIPSYREREFRGIAFWRVDRDGSLSLFEEKEDGKGRVISTFASGRWLEVHAE